MSKSSEAVKNWRRKTKKFLVEAFDGKCGICNYNKCTQALELHHLNPDEKEFSFGQIRANPKSWDTIVNEARKCVLICANCHREIHANIISIPKDIKRFNEEYSYYGILAGTHKNCICGKIIIASKQHCSYDCDKKDRRIIDWDLEKDNIINMKDVKKKSFIDIAKYYSTSDKTIAKWYYKYIQV